MDINFQNGQTTSGGHIGSYNTNVTNNYGIQEPAPSKSNAVIRCPLPSSKFVGRKDELAKLRRFFGSNGLDRKVFVLIGMGGCGKSQIGFHHMHKHVLVNERYAPKSFVNRSIPPGSTC
jgi:hypothetical protein